MTATPPKAASPLSDHLVRSFRHVTDNLGPHGLPLIGRADWNDCLNLNCFSKTPGESFQTTANFESGVAGVRVHRGHVRGRGRLPGAVQDERPDAGGGLCGRGG